jgi:uncharacterized membrane protein YjfL (UPF0719 family)
MDALMDTLYIFPRGLVFVGLAIIILIVARLVQEFLTPYHIGEQLSHKDNTALAVSIAGYYFGVIIIFLGAMYEPFGIIADGNLGFTPQYWTSVGLVATYSLAGVLLLNVARILVDRLVLYQFSTEDEIIEQQNAGTGAVEFGVYIATALVIGGSISGEGGGPLTSLAFAALGIATLMLFVLFYQWTTPFDVHGEIERNNVAVGVALGGNLVAIGVIILKAVFGDFAGWVPSLVGFALFAVAGFVLLLVVRFLIDLVLFTRVKVSDELAIDGNVGVAFIESAVVISVSLILFFAV